MGGLASELLQAGQTIGFSIEGGLQAADRRGAVLHHLPGPADPLGLQLGQGNHPIHQSHRQGLVGAVLAAEEPDFARLALAHHPGQVAGPKAPVKTAHPRPRLAKHGVLRRQAQIAEQMQHLAAADGIARHQGNHHLGQAADQALQVEHIEPGQAGLIHIATIAAHALVAAGAEGPAPVGGRPDPAEQHHPHPGVVPHPGEGVAEFLHGARPEGIALVGPVDPDPGDPLLAPVKQHVLVAGGRLPVQRCWQIGSEGHGCSMAVLAILRRAWRRLASARRSVTSSSRAMGCCRAQASSRARSPARSPAATTLRPGTP